jgi:hypothetical protein
LYARMHTHALPPLFYATFNTTRRRRCAVLTLHKSCMHTHTDADIPFGHNLTKMAETAGPGKNMEQVAIEVKQKLDEQKVPISYWQWDDW